MAFLPDSKEIPWASAFSQWAVLLLGVAVLQAFHPLHEVERELGFPVAVLAAFWTAVFVLALTLVRCMVRRLRGTKQSRSPRQPGLWERILGRTGALFVGVPVGVVVGETAAPWFVRPGGSESAVVLSLWAVVALSIAGHGWLGARLGARLDRIAEDRRRERLSAPS